MDELKKYRDTLASELNSRVVPFWLDHSLDRQFGGYFNNLAEDGSVYDTTKHMWLQGREVWMWCTLHFSALENGESEKAAQYLEAAKLGYDFIRKHGLFDESKRAYFAVTREGKPLQVQRKQWSECFYVLACVLYGRAAKDEAAEAEGYRLFECFLQYCKDPSVLGRPALEGASELLELGASMFTLSMVDELRSAGGGPMRQPTQHIQQEEKQQQQQSMYENQVQAALENLRKHVHSSRRTVFERVQPDGQPDLTTANGRCLNPGHSIEGGWFTLRFAQKYYAENTEMFKELTNIGLCMIDWAFEQGWDKDHGGILYFIDSEGKVPTQLEHSMKLWWPMTEAMVAMLTAYQATGKQTYLDKFRLVTDFSLKVFAKTPKGGWYGYADKQANVTSTNIGAPYKGFFHVPRALLYCVELLDAILKQQQNKAQ
mmetsp:Transcript_16884/g.32972  ORF Transcript_16884/g.32972 Transcript_16884/m.32972 type:complete len:429 (+) Transcript_16884:17-1303(+)